MPFPPRTASGDHSYLISQSALELAAAAGGVSGSPGRTGILQQSQQQQQHRPMMHRGRFQSDIGDSLSTWKKKPWPTSLDELGSSGGAGQGALGGGRTRSRIESMVSLGGESSNFSASDGEGSTSCGFLDVLLVVVVLGDDLHTLSDEVRVEPDAELSNHGDVGTGRESAPP